MTSFFGLRSKTRFDDVLIAACLIDFLHPAGVFGVTFEWRHVVDGDVLADALSLVLIDAKTELDHAVDSLSVKGGVLEGESGRQKGGLEEEENQVLDRLVILVSVGLLAEGVDDRVVGVDLEVLLGSHVPHGGGISESLEG